MLAALGVITLAFTGGFTVYTYLAAVLHDAASIDHAALGVMLLIFGLAAVAGNALGGHATDHYGPRRTLAAGLAGLTAALAALGLLTSLSPTPHQFAYALAAVAIAVWAIAGWTITPAQQHRLISFALEAPPVVLSLNASAMYGGIALGGAIGGLVLTHGSAAPLPFIGAACALSALGLLTVTRHLGAIRTQTREAGAIG